MNKNALVLLSRRPELYKVVAAWRLASTEVFLFDSPSEALAKLATEPAALFLFDTLGYKRFRNVVRKFFSLRGDADLIALGEGVSVPSEGQGQHPGAVRYLGSDISAEELRVEVERLLQLRRVRQRSGIVGRSKAVSQMLSLIAHAAPVDVTILIQGESGTGKELVARAIHDHSARRTGPFLSLNCGAMSEGVLESELFGHARGAFTGAVSAHDGVFKRANGGTLFLDEVAEMPLGMQTRFLRALETGEFTPVGGSEVLRSEIRLVAATNRELAQEVEAGRFRQDLYYRLRVIVIPTPPLRERKDDIPILAETFLAQENKRHGLSVRGIGRTAMQLLETYPWPGNIRELRNVISSVVVIKRTGMVDAADLPAEIRHGDVFAGGLNLPVVIPQGQGQMERGLLTATLLELREDIKEIKEMLQGRLAGGAGMAGPIGSGVVETFAGESGYSPVSGAESGDLQAAERSLIEAALRASGGRRKQAADRLGISERTLYRKIKRYEL